MQIHHLAFRTDDVIRLAAFYRDVLGLLPADGPAQQGAPRSVWLWAGATRLMIERRDPLEPSIPLGSMEFTAFAILAEQREGFERALTAAGVVVEQRTDFTVYFRDPDGRRVGVSHYPARPEYPREASPFASPTLT